MTNHPMSPFETAGHFSSDNPNELNNSMLYYAETFGEKESLEGYEIEEISPCVVTLKNPYRRITFSNSFGISIGQMCAKLLWTIMGRSDKEFLRLFNHPYVHQAELDTFAAPFGERMFMYGRSDLRDMTYNPANQFVNATQLLLRHPTSNAIVCGIWNPHFETPTYIDSKREYPSILSIQYRIRRGALDCTVYCRKLNIPAELFTDVLFECAVLHELMYSLLYNGKISVPGFRMGNLTFMTDSAYTFEGETRRDYEVAPFTFETECEPRITLALDDLEQFNEFVYRRVIPFLMDDTCVMCGDVRESFYNELSDQYANGILDEFWITVIKLALAERLMRMQEFSAALWCVEFTDVSSYTAQFLHAFSHEILVTRNTLVSQRKSFDDEIGIGEYERVSKKYHELVQRQIRFTKPTPHKQTAIADYLKFEVQ